MLSAAMRRSCRCTVLPSPGAAASHARALTAWSECRARNRRRSDGVSCSALALRRGLASNSGSSQPTVSAPADDSLAPRLFSALRLSSFSQEELAAVFARADVRGRGRLEFEDVRALLLHSWAASPASENQVADVDAVALLLMQRAARGGSGSITFEEFKQAITTMAEVRDGRIWPLSATMLVAGLAVGITIPVMPLLVHSLGLSAAQYGTVISAFGIAKLLSNVPSAVLVDTYGRRTSMTAGLSVVSCSMLALANAGSLEAMLAARAMTGIGVSGLLAGATMAVADISTPLNRARMMAPMTVAFSTGTVLGPAIGGSLAGIGGTSFTFCSVAAVFALNAMCTQLFTTETKPSPARSAPAFADTGPAQAEHHPTDDLTAKASVAAAASAVRNPDSPVNERRQGAYGALVHTVQQWRPLLAYAELRNVLVLNAAYWFALSGTQMTLLPLMLADAERFSLTPAQIGMLFAFQSAVSVAGAAPSAWLADRIGPGRMLAPAMLTTASAIAAFPFTVDVPQAVGVLFVWSVGGTMLGSAPTAHASNIVGSQNRAQALALLRTAGDVGLLFGASTVGASATMLGNDVAMQGTSAFLFSSAVLYTMRHWLLPARLQAQRGSLRDPSSR